MITVNFNVKLQIVIIEVKVLYVYSDYYYLEP